MLFDVNFLNMSATCSVSPIWATNSAGGTRIEDEAREDEAGEAREDEAGEAREDEAGEDEAEAVTPGEEDEFNDDAEFIV